MYLTSETYLKHSSIWPKHSLVGLSIIVFCFVDISRQTLVTCIALVVLSVACYSWGLKHVNIYIYIQSAHLGPKGLSGSQDLVGFSMSFTPPNYFHGIRYWCLLWRSHNPEENIMWFSKCCAFASFFCSFNAMY